LSAAVSNPELALYPPILIEETEDPGSGLMRIRANAPGHLTILILSQEIEETVEKIFPPRLA
jgi:hypothetical protein